METTIYGLKYENYDEYLNRYKRDYTAEPHRCEACGEETFQHLVQLDGMMQCPDCYEYHNRNNEEEREFLSHKDQNLWDSLADIFNWTDAEKKQKFAHNFPDEDECNCEAVVL